MWPAARRLNMGDHLPGRLLTFNASRHWCQGSPRSARARGVDGVAREMCIVRHMSRVQVYLPDELHQQVKEHGLSPSELLQRAVREELRRRELETATDAYLAELIEEVGQPSVADVEYAQRLVEQLTQPAARRAG